MARAFPPSLLWPAVRSAAMTGGFRVIETPTQNGLSSKENLLLHKMRSPEPGQPENAMEAPAFGHPRLWLCSRLAPTVTDAASFANTAAFRGTRAPFLWASSASRETFPPSPRVPSLSPRAQAEPQPDGSCPEARSVSRQLKEESEPLNQIRVGRAERGRRREGPRVLCGHCPSAEGARRDKAL